MDVWVSLLRRYGRVAIIGVRGLRSARRGQGSGQRGGLRRGCVPRLSARTMNFKIISHQEPPPMSTTISPSNVEKCCLLDTY